MRVSCCAIDFLTPSELKTIAGITTIQQWNANSQRQFVILCIACLLLRKPTETVYVLDIFLIHFIYFGGS